ncbi:MAG: hypothetical protein K8S94_03160 [Planctomycetia bacterium]|nr:hypothetical protein [Planctomycetia bacterium]
MQPKTDFTVAVAGRRLAISGDAGAAAIRPALARVETPAPGPADATLVVRSSADPAADPPFNAFATGANRGPDGSFALVSRSPSLVEGWYPGDRPRLELLASPAALAAGDLLAQPAHVAIGSWIAAGGQFLMHAAGVALGDRGVLLVGAGGRGKTTTSLACSLAGFSFLGDDLCVVAPDASAAGRHTIHGLYATAKLNADSRARLDVGDWPVLGTTPKGKTVVAAASAVSFERSARLVAIVAVRPEESAPYVPQPVSPTAAWKLLAHASTPVLGCAGTSQSWLTGLSRLARDVPMLSLEVGWDFERVVDAMRGICQGNVAPRRAPPARPRPAGVGTGAAGSRPTGVQTPVMLAVFNRPEKLRRLLAILEQSRPATLLVVADGPRRDHPDDAERCREVRRLLERVPWRCEILRNESETNLGCTDRVTSGIDWAFEHVEQAIVLEDDLVVHPGFLGWCGEMLDRYRHEPSIHCVSGRNDLGRWRDPDTDHLLVHRGSNLGCGTWRRAWQAARALPLPGPDDAIPRLRAAGLVDPYVADHFEWLRGLSSRGIEHGWDTRWELQRALLGGLSVVSSVNLVAHGGFDAEATHPWFADSLRGVQPVAAPPRPTYRMETTIDHRLDRWSLFIALMDTCRNPRMMRKLARSPALVTDGRVRHHLAPFFPSSDAAAALHQLRDIGSRSRRLDAFIEALEPVAPSPAGDDAP